MTIELVPAKESDRLFFIHVHHVSYREVIESMFGWDVISQNIHANKDFDACNPHVILYNTQPCGVMGWQEKSDHILLSPIYILPAYQGKGIGTYLVKSLIDKSRFLGIPLRLQTLLKNEKAKKFYEKLGFTVYASNDVHWQMECAI